MVPYGHLARFDQVQAIARDRLQDLSVEHPFLAFRVQQMLLSLDELPGAIFELTLKVRDALRDLYVGLQLGDLDRDGDESVGAAAQGLGQSMTIRRVG
ncbi:MAG TPA: hypothetical protein VGO93_31475 [Candidatus Xenobia bacterium]|jgi:hypothetical protein